MNLPHAGDAAAGGDPAGSGTRQPLTLGDLQKNITMAQIAKAAGVSQGAISSLLNDRDYGIRVSEKTRERVFKVCREMGYLPNDLRAVVRMYPEFGGFALLVSNRYSGGLAHPLIGRIAAAVVNAVPEVSHSLTFAFYDEATDYLAKPEHLPQPVATGIVSKFILVGAPSVSLIQTATKRGHAVISLGQDAPLPGVHSIVADHAGASQLAIAHLHQLGHRRIAIISGPFGAVDEPTIELNRGVRLACEHHGLAIDAGSILYGDLTAGAGSAALEELLSRKVAPTAIFCLSDCAAAGVLTAAQARGQSVPAQFSVLGCGDDPGAALLYPPLTTVRLPVEEMSALAVQEVDQLVRSGTLGEARKTVLPVQLIERGSCGPAKRA